MKAPRLTRAERRRRRRIVAGRVLTDRPDLGPLARRRLARAIRKGAEALERAILIDAAIDEAREDLASSPALSRAERRRLRRGL